MVNARAKGANFERELAQVLMVWCEDAAKREGYGEGYRKIQVVRNLEQTREGGFDLNGIDRALIEAKRYKLADNKWMHGLVKTWLGKIDSNRAAMERVAASGGEVGVGGAEVGGAPGSPHYGTLPSLPFTTLLVTKYDFRDIEWWVPARVTVRGGTVPIHAPVSASVAYAHLYPYITATLRRLNPRGPGAQ